MLSVYSYHIEYNITRLAQALDAGAWAKLSSACDPFEPAQA